MNMHTKFVSVALPAMFSILSQSAVAAVTVGNYNNGNCYPFSCLSTDSRDRYQQLYASAAFPGVTTVGSVTFFGDDFSIGSPVNSATYSISFYLTPVGIGSMSNVASSNLGTLLSSFGSFLVSGTMPLELTFDGTDFSYDPSAGNLLMDVNVVGATVVHPTYMSYFRADYTGATTVRGYGSGDALNNANALGALRTRFNEVGAIPEPTSLALLGIGLAGLVAARRRKVIA